MRHQRLGLHPTEGNLAGWRSLCLSATSEHGSATLRLMAMISNEGFPVQVLLFSLFVDPIQAPML